MQHSQRRQNAGGKMTCVHLFKTYNFSSLVFCRYNAGIFSSEHNI